MTSVYCLFQILGYKDATFDLLVGIFMLEKDAINERDKREKEKEGKIQHTIQIWNVQ